MTIEDQINEYADSKGLTGRKRERFIRVAKKRVGVGVDPFTLMAILNIVFNFLFGGEMNVQISSPGDGASLKAGSKGTISLTATHNSITDLASIVTGEAIIRDLNGNIIWQGSAAFSKYTANIELNFPSIPGKYTIEGRVLGILKLVNAVSKSSFEVV